MIKDFAVVLENLRSVYNVASIFRTADAVGASKIYLVGSSPTPLDRFGRERKDFAKVALGAQNTVPWEYFESIKDALDKLRKLGFSVIALEQDENSKSLSSFKAPEKLALVLGNEPSGIEQDTLKLCDNIVEIPMFGKKESLNVSVAFGVAAYCLKLKNSK